MSFFSPEEYGLSCYSCYNCNTNFGIDCFLSIKKPNCPFCLSDDTRRTNERAVKIVREWDSIEEYKEELKSLDCNNKINKSKRPDGIIIKENFKNI